MGEDSTMKFFTNLDRAGIEARLREVCAMAESGKFTTVAGCALCRFSPRSPAALYLEPKDCSSDHGEKR